jgi:RNase P/RNase MRP subunit p29
VIGKNIQVIEASNKTLIGVKGVVVDETYFTFVIQTNHGLKRVLKRSCVFENNGRRIDGRTLEKRPYEKQ